MTKPEFYQRQRDEMVERQIRGRGVKDERVIAAMQKIPRHMFVDKAFVDRAYDDGPLPLPERQTISQPYMVALMTQSLLLTGKEKVLEIGTGSGYQTAILSRLADRVFSIERHPRLGRQAERTLHDLGIHNALVRIGDGTHGWAEEAPFDAILVTAGAPKVPAAYLDQLKDDGRLVIPIGDDVEQILYRFTKTKEAIFEEELVACRFVKLVGRYGWEAVK